jgi:aminopeptidase N
MPIPLAMGLIGPNGDEMPTRVEGESEARPGTRVLLPNAERALFRFEEVPAAPVPSLLRNFSAPVKLQGVPLERLKFLAIHDTDPVARWDSGQQVAIRVLLDRVEAHRRGQAMPALDPDLVAAMRQTLAGAERDPEFAAEALYLPGEMTLADEMPTVDVVAIHAARETARHELGDALREQFAAAYRDLADPGPYRIDARSIGRRALRNMALSYLAAADRREGARLAKAQFDIGANMTDVLAALGVLVDTDCPERAAALAAFYERWREDPLVLDKWFSLQARSSLPGTIEAVRELARHPDFNRGNPNRVRALVGAFAQGNQLYFHDASGEGYRFLADEVIALDRANPQTAARLVQPLGQWKRQDAARQGLMRAQLDRILAAPGLSANTYEMVSKSLAA